MAVVFLAAAALLLPPQLVALMGLAQHALDLTGRRFPSYITAFNIASHTLSVLAAWGVAALIDATELEPDLRWACAGIAAALVLVAVDHTLLAAMLRLARGRSFRSSGLLSPSALLADFALAGLGVVLARFWLFNPYLIPVVVAPLFLVQRSFTLLARLGESEERFRTMFEGAPTGTIIVGLDQRVVSSNRAFETLAGYEKSELLGKSLAGLIPDEDGQAEPLRELLSGARETYSGQLRLARNDGSHLWGQVAAALVLDAQRRPRFVIVMVEDLTERMQLEEQLRHSQRMEAVGQLAGGIAHDFNNLLTIIAGRTRIALRGLTTEDEPVRSDLEEISAAAERAAGLTHQLLAYSRRQMLQPRVIDLNDVVSDLERMLRRLIGEHIEIELDLAPGLGRVRADRGQLEQVLVNLALNARDAMDDGGRLTIRTANVDLDVPAADPAPGVLLSVRDTGHGMDELTRARIFEPFFTTKDPGKGTGLGLATVYGIIAQSGGRLRVESSPGAGSTFAVFLPRVEEEISREVAPDPPAVDSSGSETVLVAEDDDGVRALVELVLSRSGYRVLGARDGFEALRVAALEAQPIDLLLTDMVMPRMKGSDLAEALAETQPEMRVLYMSGYADAATLPNGSGGTVVPKPFSEETLVQMVRAALDGRETSAAAAVGSNGPQAHA